MATIQNDRDTLLRDGHARNIDPSRGKIVLVKPSADIFKVAADSSVYPTSIDFSAVVMGAPTGSVVTWTATAGATLTGTGNARTLTAANLTAANATITATITIDGIEYSDSTVVTKVSDGTQGVKGDKGADGIQYYTWIKYADDASGGGLSDSPTGKTYIGLAHNKTSAVESTVAGDYAWSLIQGPQGNQGIQGPVGPDGAPTYTWIKYSDVADGTGLYDTPTSNTMYIGISPNRTTQTESSVKTDYVWSKFRGEDGARSLVRDITDSMWVGADLATVTDGPVGTQVRRSSGYSVLEVNKLTTIDRTRTYRTRFWARAAAGTNGYLYHTLQQYKADGSFGPDNGGRDPYQPGGVAAHTDWREYDNTWSPSEWQDGVTQVSPDFLMNYGGTAGYWEIQGYEWFDATDAVRAQAIADAAKARTDSISANNVLDRSEKPGLVTEWQVADLDKASLVPQAAALGVSSTAYVAAHQAVSDYLVSITPSWSDVTTDTNIDRDIFRARWKTYYDEKLKLQNALDAKAATTANSDYNIRTPGGGVYSTTTSVVNGAIKIRLPQSWSSTMMRFTVDIYEYNAGYSCTVEIAGYNDGPSSQWYNCTARVIGNSNVEYPVYFGHDGTKCCVWIGNAATESWAYPQVNVRDFFAGFSGFTKSLWESGWQISFSTAAPTNVTGTVLDTYPGADWSKSARRPANLAALTGSEGINNANVSISSTGALQGAGGGQVVTIPVRDIVSERSINRPPNWYPVGTTREFKESAAVGLGGYDTYLTLETVIQYADASGGAVYQYAYRGTTTWRRWGTAGASSWAGAWVQDLDRNAYTGDLNATRDVTLIGFNAVAVKGNSAVKDAGSPYAWDSQVKSQEGFVGGAYASARMDGLHILMFGLNSDPDTDAHFGTLDFAIYPYVDGNIQAYANGSNLGPNIGTYVAGDVLGVMYDGTNVYYLKNGTVLKTYTPPTRITAPLYFDSSFYSPTSSISAIRFGPMSSNNWANVGGTGKPSDNASSDITLIGRGVEVQGNYLKKTQQSSGWDADAYSKESAQYAFASATVTDLATLVIFGLNDDPALDSNYTGIFANFYLTGSSTAYTGVNADFYTPFTVAVGDVLLVTYDGVNVRWYKNGVMIREWAYALNGTPLYFDSSIASIGGTLGNVRFGPVTSALWAHQGGAGKPQDNATVGAPAGTNVGSTPATTVEANAAAGNTANTQLANKPVVNAGQDIDSTAGTGTRILGSRTATVTGGNGTIKYDWKVTIQDNPYDGDVWISTASDVASVTFKGTCSVSGGYIIATATCTVVDGVGLGSTDSLVIKAYF